jgi:hypothetical protein
MEAQAKARSERLRRELAALNDAPAPQPSAAQASVRPN